MNEEERIQTLIETLSDGRGQAFLEAVDQLASIGEPAVEALLAALNHENAHIRKWAVWVLRKIGGERAVKALIRVLLNEAEDQHVLDMAAYCLGQLRATSAIEALIAALQYEYPSVRTKATYALEKIGDVRAVEPLINVLQDSEYEVRERSAYALGKIRDRRAVAPLLRAIEEDESSDVRIAAASALGDLGDTIALEPLIRLLADGSKAIDRGWKVAWTAARALGELGDGRASEALVPILESPDTSFRHYAATSLVKIDGDYAQAGFERLVADSMKGDSYVRFSAKRALRELGYYPWYKGLVHMRIWRIVVTQIGRRRR